MPEDEKTSLKSSAQKVQDHLTRLGLETRVVELPDSARTAKLAAEAIGCEVAQIASSLIFRGLDSGRALLVIASGAARVDEKRLAELAGEPIGKADADFVRKTTGFAIGGVAPVAHPEPLDTWIDRDLMRFEVVWAAAGHPKAVFSLAPADLPRLTAGSVADVR